jgi:hypothetical protein
MLLIFDIWHASVALLSGIAFYMWMALNIIFTLALGLVRRPMTWSFRLFLVFGMLVASFGFKIFWAGWFDTRGVNLVTLTAEYRDGSEARVPPTIYDFYSYRFYSDAMLDHSWWSKYALPVSFFGSSKIADVRHKMEECTQPPANPGRENSIVFNPAMLRLIRSFHPVVIERSGHSGGRLIYAHHFLQDPAVFSAFRSRNPRDIVSYRVSVDLVCQRVTAAGIEKTVLYSAQTRVRVDGRPAASASP